MMTNNVHSTSHPIHDGHYLPLDHCLRKHVKPKKQHEILKLGKALRLLGDATNCKHIVDVGAGQGHLSRLLTFEYDFKVTTVEAASRHAPKAEKFDRDAQLHILKKRKQNERKMNPSDVISDDTESVDNLPDHVTCFIHSDASKTEFLKIVQKTFSRDSEKHIVSSHYSNKRADIENFIVKDQNDILESNSNISTSDQNFTQDENCYRKDFLLTGLHACGDLTATMIRVFVSCSEIRGLGCVGCCYMKLSDASTSPKADKGYPMSQFIQHIPHHQLSYEAREMACHFLDNYIERLQENVPALKLHCYRASLQTIIQYLNPSYDHGCIKLAVKKAENLDFRQYAEIGLQKLGIHSEIPDYIFEQAEKYLLSWKTVVAFYTLRLSLAPVVESLILLDRMIFLYEHGIESALVPVFDPKLSPRNFVLLAHKTEEVSA